VCEDGLWQRSKWTQPGQHWENPETKTRIHSLLCVSGVVDYAERVRARKASVDELCMFHTKEYVNSIIEKSLQDGGEAGECARFGPGGFEIAQLSCGGVLAAVEHILSGKIENAFCLVRPPGHHAEADMGMGFCMFNNVVIAAKHAQRNGVKRIAIIDYDVHHGNGTETAFKEDENVLFVSVHQDGNYPIGRGGEEVNNDTTVNVPLPPGCGSGAYAYCFDRVVIPLIDRFKPDFIFVSSGLDASFCDPLARMMLSSSDFGEMARKLVGKANEHCAGRICFVHEGGYAKEYVPLCALRVFEELVGKKTNVVDDYLDEVGNWGYQECQPWQTQLIDRVATGVGLYKV